MLTITIADGLLVFVTFSGPIAAVQVQKWIERSQNKQNRRMALFQTLMATRAIRAGSADHVQSLNLIDLFFDGKAQKEKAVRAAWSIYRDFLNQRLPSGSTEGEWGIHNEKGVDFLIDLLEAMGKSLGYDFDRVTLKRGVYYPQVHADEALAAQKIREGLVKVLNGNSTLKMDVTSLPISEDALKSQNAIQTALLSVLSGNGTLRIRSES